MTPREFVSGITAGLVGGLLFVAALLSLPWVGAALVGMAR